MATPQKKTDYVQTFGKKKNATAVAICRPGKGTIRVNGVPIEILEPKLMKDRLLEPILLLGIDKFSKFDIRIRVRGGGQVAQLYAARLALAKSIVAYHQKFVDEQSKRHIKELLLEYDRGLLVADPRRCEPKKFGGKGARTRKQKSFR